MHPEISEVLKEATFVFLGTVTGVARSTMREVPVTDATVVVRVDEIIVAPESFRAPPEVTVLLPRELRLDEGAVQIFYSVGWIYGSGLAVRALDVRAPESPVIELPPGLAEASVSVAGEDLRTRVEGADVIVSGQVAQVRKPDYAEPTHVSEHDPEWREAVVDVSSVEKGTSPGNQVVVCFPESMDVMWHRAPKFAAGQRGVWLLRSPAAESTDLKATAKPGALPAHVYTALHPLDFHEEDRVGLVRSLVDR